MKTIILNYIDISRKQRVKNYPISGIKFPTFQIFAIFARVLTFTGSKLRTFCTLKNLAMTVAIIAALIAWFAGVIVSVTDSFGSRLTLVISVIVAIVALVVTFSNNLGKESEI